MKFLILILCVVGTIADVSHVLESGLRAPDPENNPVLDEKDDHASSVQTTASNNNAPGYNYLPPPDVPQGYHYEKQGIGELCHCPAPRLKFVDVNFTVSIPYTKTSVFTEKPFDVTLEEYAEVPNYKYKTKKKKVQIKRWNVTERVEKKYKPVTLKKICEKPSFPEQTPKPRFESKRVKVTIERIEEVPIYEEVFNVTYVDVPVDVVVNKIIERPFPKPKIILKYVDVPVDNIIENVIEKRVDIPLKRTIERPIYKKKPVDLIDIPVIDKECVPMRRPQCPPQPRCPESPVRCPECNCKTTGYLPPQPLYLPSAGK